jgi:hypothetical protein
MSVLSKNCAFVVVLIVAMPANAESLGRLFFTPEQRSELEYSKLQKQDLGENSSTLTVSGIVQRYGGARTVWINGEPKNAGKSDERAPESLQVPVPGQLQPVKVKVGQKILINRNAPERPISSNP